ncbi:MAG: CoA transferase [Actinomycetia bacterium]|nr:CoA transferase [Actinomycetes bacterium]MCP5034539.1 CoA transferase [Actinomycetes bacterium]
MLSSYRVVDLTDERGHLAGFIWAQMGADVVSVEPPGGASSRRLLPFAGDIEDPERSLHHWAYNRGKRSVVVDLETEEGRTDLRRLMDGADVVFESFAPGTLDALGLGYDDLAVSNPALIYVSITPFGSDGPKANWHATDLTIQAAAGNMVLTGETDRAPLRAGGTVPQAFHNAASEAAGAALIALHERQSRSGLGQFIDASAQQSMNQATQSMSLATPLGGTPPTRMSGGVLLQGIKIQLMWPCKDGYASVTLLFGLAFARFAQNLMDWVCEEGFCDEATRDKDWVNYTQLLLDGTESEEEYERVKAVLGEFFATKTKAELLANAMSRRLLITPITTTEDVASSEQLAFRDYWEDVEQPDVGTVRYPGAFARFAKSPLNELGPPPTLGQHTLEVLNEKPRLPSVAVAEPNPSTEPPLAGIKIVDLMWAMAGPAASRVLADYGADVIRIESENKIDAVRTLQPFPDDVADPELSGIYNNMNAGKRGLALDMSKPEAIDVIWDLIDWADVVLESFSPRAMAGWGLGYDAIKARRPDIIMASSCLMGQSGPVSSLAGFGTMAAAISGFFYPVGWPDRAPTGPYSAYTDYISPRWLVAAIMGALEHRRATGEGQYIDLSQAEAALHMMTPALLERTVNGRTWERAGNRDLDMAPQGAYATKGDDRWIAIACVDDAAWSILANELGATDLTDLSLAERRARHDELDERIEARTRELDGDELMVRLQGLGVAAHIIQNSPELVADPQLTHRGHFVTVEHGKADSFVVDGSRFRLSRTPAVITHGGPCFGEHTFEILTDILGYDGDRIADLAVAELLE